jgi:RNA polymerase sigma-70 factor (ECF subfamily)
MSDAPTVHNRPSGLTPPAAFTAFMRSYQDMVFTTAARMLADDAQAEDIAQEVFIRAHDHFAMLAESPTAGGWLKTVTVRLCLNHLQRYRRRWRFFSEMSHPTDESDGEEADFPAPDVFHADLDRAEQRTALESALALLPEHRRVPLVLYHFAELSYEEIAEKLRISLSKVKTDIHRGRAALARSLAGSGSAKTNPVLNQP